MLDARARLTKVAGTERVQNLVGRAGVLQLAVPAAGTRHWGEGPGEAPPAESGGRAVRAGWGSPPTGPSIFTLSETCCCGRSLVFPIRKTRVPGPAGSGLEGWGAARGLGLGAVRGLTCAAQAGAIGDSCDAEAVPGGEAAAVQDGGPGVSVASHDGGTAGLHRLTQAAARVDDPAEVGGSIGWRGAHDFLIPALGLLAHLCAEAQPVTRRLLGNDTWSPGNSVSCTPSQRFGPIPPTVFPWLWPLSSFPAHLPLELWRKSSARERGVCEGPCTLGLHSAFWKEKAEPSLLS